MPLIAIPRSPAPTAIGFEIGTRTPDGDQVRVHVTRQAINAMDAQSTDALSGLKAHRQRFDEIASAKYDAGQIQSDGSVLVDVPDVL